MAIELVRLCGVESIYCYYYLFFIFYLLLLLLLLLLSLWLLLISLLSSSPQSVHLADTDPTVEAFAVLDVRSLHRPDVSVTWNTATVVAGQGGKEVISGVRHVSFFVLFSSPLFLNL